MAGAVIIGVGPGIGTAVARRFAREGMPISIVARRQETVDAALAVLEGDGAETLGLVADAGDEEALRAALDEVVGRFGVPDVLVYNAAVIQADAPGDLTAQGHLDAWAVNVVGALVAAVHLAPRMAERGAGTVLLTGGMPEPVPEYASLSLGKAGVRTLTDLLDRAYGPLGVHFATITVHGSVAPGTPFDPDDIAEYYWTLHTQPRDRWEREKAYTGG